MTAIYKRELRAYLTSMVGCIVMAFFIATGGLYFMVYNLLNGYAYFSYALYSTTFFLMIAVPILTMRCFAEEKKNKTEQLLMTAPVSLTNVVLGKYFAMMTIFAVPNIVFCTMPLIISMYGESFFVVDYSAILAYYLLGSVFIAVGMFLSSLTESQVIAAITTLGVLYVLYMWDGIIEILPFTSLQNILGKFSLVDIFANFAIYQIFDVTGLIVYLSVSGIFVFLTIQTLQKRRWS